MMSYLINSHWGADISPFTDRVYQALLCIEKIFSETTFWEARPSHPTSPSDRFKARNEVEIQNIGGKLNRIWQKTLSAFSERNMDLNQTRVESSAFSEEMDFSVYIYISGFELSIEVELDEVTPILKKHLDKMLLLLKDLGTSNTASGWWLSHKSAFAGDIAALYEPKTTFNKFYDILRYKEVIEPVRELRESVRAAVSPEKFMLILKELGLEAEPLPGGRVFVRLGDPLGKGSAAMLKQIEQKISPLLKSKSK